VDEAAGEECDDGNRDNSDLCPDNPDTDPPGRCRAAFCGDGFVQVGMEECDEGDNLSDTEPDACRTVCLLPACGDGVLDTGEAGCCWENAVTVTTPDEPGTIASAYMNPDSHLDVLVAGGQQSVSVFLSDGAGGGSHAANSPISVGGYVTDLVVADFDGDSDPDVAAALGYGSWISLLRNNGGGDLSYNGTLSISRPSGTAVAHMNQDTALDLISASRENCMVYVWTGRPTGFFDEPAVETWLGLTCQTEQEQPYIVRAADLDGDGADDVVVSTEWNRVLVFRGDNTGSLSLADTVELSPGKIRDLRLTDVNGDGRADIAYLLGLLPQSRLGILLQDANLTFVQDPDQEYLAGPSSWALRPVDLEGNQTVDLVAVDRAWPGLFVFMGDGTGRFAQAMRSPIWLDIAGDDLTVADFDQDGYPDIGIVESGSNRYEVWLARP
jgi:hypothetical protein